MLIFVNIFAQPVHTIVTHIYVRKHVNVCRLRLGFGGRVITTVSEFKAMKSDEVYLKIFSVKIWNGVCWRTT